MQSLLQDRAGAVFCGLGWIDLKLGRLLATLVIDTRGEFQMITTEGFKAYVDAIQYSLGTRADLAQMTTVYSASGEGEHRYSPAEVVDVVPVRQWGNPNLDQICTSHVERQNLMMRMGVRRLTRLTNAFSKKWEHLKAALAVYFAHYNFVRVH